MLNLPCVKCKGRNPLKYCGMDYCILYSKNKNLFKIKELRSEEFLASSPPSIFIGSKLKYPEVNVGILSPMGVDKDAWIYDNPRYWVENNLKMKDVIRMRASLLNSRFRGNVYRLNDKFINIAQEVGMAYKPVDIEFKIDKIPKVKLDYEQISLPRGPVSKLQKAKIAENTKIHTKVDKVVDDYDLKAMDALSYLNKSGFDEHSLTQLLSIGVLGRKRNRKLVPTRFSITAVDNSIGREYIRKIKDCNIINEYKLFYGCYFGNYYLILMFPELWQYELFEGYMPFSLWNPSKELRVMTDYEDYYGRKEYAFNTVGGYYAARIGVLEYLNKVKRQASILVIRFETPAYETPLGVFVVREASRKTMGNEIKFIDKKSMMDKAKDIVKKLFNYDLDNILKQSILLKKLKEQRRLFEF